MPLRNYSLTHSYFPLQPNPLIGFWWLQHDIRDRNRDISLPTSLTLPAMWLFTHVHNTASSRCVYCSLVMSSSRCVYCSLVMSSSRCVYCSLVMSSSRCVYCTLVMSSSRCVYCTLVMSSSRCVYCTLVMSSMCVMWISYSSIIYQDLWDQFDLVTFLPLGLSFWSSYSS